MSDERPQSRESHSAKPSIFGDGLPERLRSTSFALLGITVAAGLVLVGLVFHQSWPVAPDLPIPGIPPEHEAVHERAVVAEAVDPEGVRGRTRAVATGRSGVLAEPGGAVRPQPRLAAADRVVAQQPTASSPDPDPAPPVNEQPPGGAPPAPQPGTPQPVEAPSPPSQPSPTPAESPPPAAASIDDAEEGSGDDDGDAGGQGYGDDRGDEGEKGEGRDRGQGRPKGVRKQKPPPPPVESGEDAPVQPPAAPQEEPGEDELDEDEPELDDQQDEGRGHGHWRRGR